MYISKTLKCSLLFGIQNLVRCQSSDGIDQLFVMDCTGSMGDVIETAKTKILDLNDGIKTRYPFYTLRLGFIGYRDIGEWTDNDASGNIKQYIKIPFTDNHVGFQQQLNSSVEANGGGDHPEDVYAGLEAASTMQWKGSIRMLTLLADAPHNEGAGRKRYEDFVPILKKFADDSTKDSAVFTFIFFNIGHGTYDMGEKLRKMMPDGVEYIEHRLNEDGSSVVIPARVSKIPKQPVVASPVVASSGTYMGTVLDDIDHAVIKKVEASFF